MLTIKEGRSMRRKVLVALMASMLVSGLSNLTSMAAALEAFRALAPEQQRPAPAFALPDHQGVPIDLADLQGKVMVVRFWATW
jgi:cytochrome oxidase Cu insertion factor (SCO1/SenC/PrrC family)